jgi:redox-sensing transcriptional repressor
VQIAVVAVPASAAQSVIDSVAAAGIPAILNFAPARIQVPSHMSVRNVDLKIQLESLAFRLVSERRPPAARERRGRP